LFLCGLLGIVGLDDQIGTWTWIAVGLILLEGVILAAF